MLLADRRVWRIAGLAVMVALWPELAAAQAQVEAVPEAPPPFDMWNLEGLEDPAIQLPDDSVPAPLLDSVDAGQPAAPDPPGATGASDACRHFTEEERRLLPSLCGASD